MAKRKLSDVDQSVGKALKKYRVMSGLTQEQVAKIICINRTTYTKYESGVSEPSLEILKKIADIFGVPVINLISSDEISLRVADSNEMSPELNSKIMERVNLLSRSDKIKLIKIIDEMLKKSILAQY